MKLTARHTPMQAARLVKELAARGLDVKATLAAWDTATVELADTGLESGGVVLLDIYVQTHSHSERGARVSVGNYPGAGCEIHNPMQQCLYHPNANGGSAMTAALLHLIDNGRQPATASEMLTDAPY